MDKFKSGDQVKMINYKGNVFYDDTVGEIPEEDVLDLKKTTGKVVRIEKSYGCTFYVVDFNVNSVRETWWIHEDDLELAVKNELSEQPSKGEQVNKFNVGDKVKMVRYSGDYLYHSTNGGPGTLGEICFLGKEYNVLDPIDSEKYKHFIRVLDANTDEWFIHEDDLELVKDETSVKIEIDASKAIEQLQAVFPTNETVPLRKCDLNFLFDQFELDSINGKKYTALLQHFIYNS